MTCLFIGSKIEEEMRPVPVVIRVFYRIYQRRTGQEVTKLTETDPVPFYSSFEITAFSALAFHSNRCRKASSLHIWISSVRNHRSSPTIHFVLRSQAWMRFIDGSTLLEHFERHVFLHRAFHVVSSCLCVCPIPPTLSLVLRFTSLPCKSLFFGTS